MIHDDRGRFSPIRTPIALLLLAGLAAPCLAASPREEGESKSLAETVKGTQVPAGS